VIGPKPHPFKTIREDSYVSACETLDQIINIGN